MGQIQSFTPDVVLAIETGADAARLLQQWSNFGLKNTIPLVTSQNTTDQSVIRNLSAAEVEGIVSCAHYAEGRDDPSIRKFVDAYENSYKKIPSIFAAEGYTAAIWIADAVSKMNGQVEDRKRLLDTIMKDTIADSPLGKNLKMDAYGNPVYTIYIRKVARRADGKLVNTVIDTYPNVSQFGRLKPEEYLKQPPFSRQFQGVQK
jgi:branched-chain amino acid transport system substrate-binding protein